ncbi:MAG TPA: DUF2935 domain-containing protein [Clostridiales bacterium]|nr:DUF2935 domain-containing protein [Clostridiales bacterium]
MISCMEFVRRSLELHLFFSRIMKEHSFFLEIGFTQRDAGFIQTADSLRREFDSFLAEVVSLSSGVVSNDVLQSGEVVTQYTANAEMATSFLTGIRIPVQLTQEEMRLTGGTFHCTPALEQRIYMLNDRAIKLVNAIIQFKTAVLSEVLACKMFTVNYPLLIEHILREARLYLSMIQRLQNREMPNQQREVLEQELFWNRIMAEHAKFIRGLLDPTEEALFETANAFGNEFDQLTNEAKQAIDRTLPASKVTDDSLAATKRIRDFKAAGTQGLLDCKIRSIIIPLLGDHVLREANHYLRLLKIFEQIT